MRLLLPCSFGSEHLLPFLAVLRLTPELAASLLRYADALRAARDVEPTINEVSAFSHTPDFYVNDIGADFQGDQPVENEGLVFSESDRAQLEFRTVNVTRSFAEEGSTLFHWSACIKHTNHIVETCEITEQYLRDFLAAQQV